eukprot:scaffold42038_cov73-Phaeocystis_antarctica.AAC.3
MSRSPLLIGMVGCWRSVNATLNWCSMKRGASEPTTSTSESMSAMWNRCAPAHMCFPAAASATKLASVASLLLHTCFLTLRPGIFSVTSLLYGSWYRSTCSCCDKGVQPSQPMVVSLSVNRTLQL